MQLLSAILIGQVYSCPNLDALRLWNQKPVVQTRGKPSLCSASPPHLSKPDPPERANGQLGNYRRVRCPKVLEPRTLTVRRSYPIHWKRDKVDLTKLANLRWINKWRIERIAAHLDLGTAIDRAYPPNENWPRRGWYQPSAPACGPVP